MDKSLRGENDLQSRLDRSRSLVGPAVDEEHDNEVANTKPSKFWQDRPTKGGVPAEGSDREYQIAKRGAQGSAREVPFKAELESQLGTDLSNVRAFTGGPAAKQAADELGAYAYATDDDELVFAEDNPDKALVAHEVVHTQQKRGGGSVGSDEAEADILGDKLAAGEQVAAGSVASGGGRVRKKAKGLTELFKDFVAGKTEDANTPEDGTETVANLPDFGLRSVENVQVEQSATGHETTTVTQIGTADPKSDLDRTIDVVKLEIVGDCMKRNWQRITLSTENEQIDRQLAALATRDEFLVTEQHRVLLAKRERNVAAITELDTQLQRNTALLGQLEQTRVKLQGSDSDPKELARKAAAMEASFRATDQNTQKSHNKLDLLAGTWDRGESSEDVMYDDEGEEISKTKTASSKQTSVGGGSLKHTKKQASEVNGESTERESTTEVGATAKDGIVLGKENKLTKALDTSVGKTTFGTTCGGKVNVNFVELPKADKKDPQLYGLAITMNLSAGIEAGQDLGNDKLKVGGKVSAGASVQLTQTYVLDKAGVLHYLALLAKAEDEKAGKEAAAAKPELKALYDSLHQPTTADPLSSLAAFGDANAAKHMRPDESVELTMKVNAGIEGSAGSGDAETKGASGTVGRNHEEFRTVKVARKSGKNGEAMVEVTVGFGNSNEMHGALTAAAFGVKLGAGKKQGWGNESTVAFELDSGAPDYAALFEEITSTVSVEQLVALRKSKRMAEHVQSYSEKHSVNDERSNSIGSDFLGTSGKQTSSWDSSASRDKDGNLTVTESAKQGYERNFSVGPLDVLRYTQTAGADFEHGDGVSMLDIYEETETKQLSAWDNLRNWATGENTEGLPSKSDIWESENPTKMVETALTETNTTMKGFFLDPEDLDRLAIRARDTAAWSHVWIHVDGKVSKPTNDRWMWLAGKLVKPDVAKGLPPEQIDLARDLARARHIAEFVKTSEDGVAKQMFEGVLRNYELSGGDGADLGVSYDFGDEALEKSEYVALRRACKGVETKLGGMGTGQLDEGLAYCADLELQLADMLDTVESAEFAHETSRTELTLELRRFAEDITRARNAFRTRCGLTVDDAATQAARIHHLEASAEAAKASEQNLYDRARDLEETGTSLNAALAPIVGELERIYELHHGVNTELRALYSARYASKPDEIGYAPDLWKVSPYGAQNEHRRLDPHLSSGLAILDRKLAATGYTAGFSKGEIEAQKAEWQRKWGQIVSQEALWKAAATKAAHRKQELATRH